MKLRLLTILALFLPVAAIADPVEINGIYYNLVSKAKEAEVVNPKGNYYNSTYSGNVVIPATVVYNNVTYDVKTIGSNAFYGCVDLVSVTIPNSVTSIGSSAFSGCEKLTSFNIPNNLTSLGASAFKNCRNLNSIIIPNGVTKIEKSTFESCTSLKSITIPSSVIEIGQSAFTNCPSIEKIYITDLSAWCNIIYGENIWPIPNEMDQEANPLYNHIAHLYLDGKELLDLKIPDSVTAISDCAFNGYTDLKSVTIPSSVTSIGSYAFFECIGILSLDIPSSVTSISYGAFASCTGLKYLNLSNSLKTIERSCFWGCSALTSLSLPKSVESIKTYAFGSCNSLTQVTIQSKVTSIESGAFAECTELLDFYCYANKVPNTSSNAFEKSYIESVTLHVPAASVNDYKKAEPWQNFKAIVAIEGDAPENKKCDKPTISYKDGKLSFSCQTEGVSFVTDISDPDIKKHYTKSISLTATYNISVQATKSGYEDSDVVTATLCWIDAEPTTKGITNITANVRALAILIQSNDGTLTISGADDSTPIIVYSINGTEAGSAISQNGAATIPTTLQSGSAAIVKVGNKSIKVVMK